MNDNLKNVQIEEIYPLIEEKLKSGGSVVFKPNGISMMPLIVPGRDSVKIVPLSGFPDKYDILFYRRKNGRFIIHRYVGMRDGKYVMCGDNQTVREYGVTNDMLIGKVTEIIKPGRTLLVTDRDYLFYSRRRVFTQSIKRKINSFIAVTKKKFGGIK